MQFKVFIPSAGLGSRLGPYTKFVNKALLSIGNLPVIVRIIRNFPVGSQIVIAIGYRGEHIRQVVSTLCPDYDVTFVKINKFEGDGSSLGHTINECREYLQSPFIFIPNDTLIDLQEHNGLLSLESDWAGYYVKKKGDGVPVDQYRTLEVTNDQITQIHPKGIEGSNVYIGVAGIKNYQLFWKSFDQTTDIAPGEVVGLNQLPKLKGIRFNSWQDVGNISSLREAQESYQNPNINILEKEDEAIWFDKNQVVKFHVDPKFISDRVRRLKNLPEELFPKIESNDVNIFTYGKVNGDVFSKSITPNLVRTLLDNVQKSLWCYRDTNNDFIDNLDSFYREKTKSRVEYYFKRFEQTDQQLVINGKDVPSTLDLLDKVDWQHLIQNAKISRFHGDFHSENILVTEDKLFKLIDWRQNFGDGNYEFGDAYYDLAKFLHGLYVSHEQVHQNNFKINRQKKNIIDIDIYIPFKNYICISELKRWCKINGYDYAHVELITSLIFLNICGLHEHPYSEFLYYLGVYLLSEQIA